MQFLHAAIHLENKRKQAKMVSHQPFGGRALFLILIMALFKQGGATATLGTGSNGTIASSSPKLSLPVDQIIKSFLDILTKSLQAVHLDEISLPPVTVPDFMGYSFSLTNVKIKGLDQLKDNGPFIAESDLFSGSLAGGLKIVGLGIVGSVKVHLPPLPDIDGTYGVACGEPSFYIKIKASVGFPIPLPKFELQEFETHIIRCSVVYYNAWDPTSKVIELALNHYILSTYPNIIDSFINHQLKDAIKKALQVLQI